MTFFFQTSCPLLLLNFFLVPVIVSLSTNFKTLYQVVIIGGGLAGLCSALHLSLAGIKVLLIEKNDYPKHKVCGEYVSNEVLPYLGWLGFDPLEFGAQKIEYLNLSTVKGRKLEVKLPLGGFGLSRYCFDWELAKKCLEAGTEIQKETVTDVEFIDPHFTVKTQAGGEISTEFVIGSFGKRSKLDIALKRPFIQNSSSYLAVKAHYKAEFPNDLVELHNFEGGYCGLSKVETQNVNVCYITTYRSFKKYKNINDFQEKVLEQNEYLKSIFQSSEMVFDKALSISQISFDKKNPIENHIIMSGDSAGMIHPLAGNGMSMAIRSAQMASVLLLGFFSGEISTRRELEEQYASRWKREFSTRLMAGRIISKSFQWGLFSELLLLFFKKNPFILKRIIRKTHGKPMEIQ